MKIIVAGGLSSRWRRRAILTALLASTTLAGSAFVRPAAADWDPLTEDKGIPHSVSDFGGIGLLQVPTARMGEEGDVSISGSFITPYQRYSISATVLPWLEGIFRSTDITNVPYGPAFFSGNQSYRDRGIDLRVRLYKEDANLPDITVGVRDIAGTGLFDAEYLAATRRYYNLDITLGMGWGELASSGQFKNPFTFLSSHFDTDRSVATAGSFRTDYFAGKYAALFGGIEYRTPWDGVTIKAEYNSSDYSSDPFNEHAKINPQLPIDVGFVYRPWSWLEMSLAEERGNTYMFRLSVLANIAHRTGAEYRSPAAPIPFKPRLAAIPSSIPGEAPAPVEQKPPTAWSSASGGDLMVFRETAARLGFRVLAVANAPQSRSVALSRLPQPQLDMSPAEAVGQVARALGRIAPVPDNVDIAVDEADGTEKRYRFSVPELERRVAVTGRTEELVDAAPVQVIAKPQRRYVELDRAIAAALFQDLNDHGFKPFGFEMRGSEAIVRADQGKYRLAARSIGEIARIIDRHLPTEARFVTIALVADDSEILRVRMPRDDMEAAFAGEGSAAELFAHTEFLSGDTFGPNAVLNDALYPSFDYYIRPRLKSQLNGPNGFFLYDLYMGLGADVSLAPGLTISGETGVSLLSNFNKLVLDSNSELPHVRTDIKNYLREGKYGISRLQADYITTLAPDLYGRLSGGLLEEMYGGVDAELLYRPYGKRWALGFEINQLYQRDFHEKFSFLDYNVATGNVALYYELPWDKTLLTLKAGRYLARDWGSTIDLSREFDNGVRIGAFATFTNVPFDKFGEGSFDKGIYISVPIDLLFPFPARTYVGYEYKPLTRDGGQNLVVNQPLYSMFSGYDPERMGRDWPEVLGH